MDVLIVLVDALMAMTALLAGVVAVSYMAVYTLVLVEVWGHRHRERAVSRHAQRIARVAEIRGPLQRPEH